MTYRFPESLSHKKCGWKIAAGAAALLILFTVQAYAEPATGSESERQLEALHLRQSGNHAKAELILKELSAEFPSNYKYPFDAAECEIEQGKFKEALGMLDKSISIAPKFAPAFLRKGNVYFVMCQSQEAIDSFSQAIKLDPKVTDYWAGRALAYNQRRNFPACFKDLKQAKLLDPANKNTLEVSAVAHLDSGQPQIALTETNQLLSLYPGDWHGSWLRARAYKDLGQWEKCLKDLDKSEKFDQPSAAEVLGVRAEVYYRMRRFEDSLGAARKSLKAQPNSYAHVMLANTYCAMGRPANALEESLKAYKISPTDGQTVSTVALCYAMKSDYRDAIKFADMAVKLYPGVDKFRLDRAKFELDNGKFQQSIDDCTQVLVRDASSVRALSIRSDAYAGLQQYAKSESDVKQLLKLDPRNPLHLVSLARCLYFSKQHNEALSLLKKVTDENPENVQIWERRFHFEQLSNRPDGMKKCITAIARLDHGNTIVKQNQVDLQRSTDNASKPDNSLSSSPAGTQPQYVPPSVSGPYQSGLKNLDAIDGVSAVRNFSLALQREPKYIDARLKRAEAYRLLGKFDLAIKDLETIRNQVPTNMFAVWELARTYYADKQFAKSLAQYNLCVNSLKRREPYMERALLFLRLKRPGDALADAQELLKFRKGVDEYKLRGDIYMQLNRTTDAIKDYSSALKIVPSNAYLLKARATAYTKIGLNAFANRDTADLERLGRELDSGSSGK